MKLLLDTHMLLVLGQGTFESKYPSHAATVQANDENFGSAASLWEMNIKIGIGKLDLGMPASPFSDYLETFGIVWLPINVEHSAAILEELPLTRDPFDRMLLAQCQVEGMKLVTVDRLLADHSLVANI